MDLQPRQTTLTFYSVLHHTDIGKSFCNFLKKEKKEETWKFIVSAQLLEVYIQKNNDKRIQKQLKQLLTNFDSKNSKFFTNDEETKILFQNISNFEDEENIHFIYKDIIMLKNKLIPTYEQEFVKFNSTTEAKKLCKTYEKNKLLVLPILSKKYEHKDIDFEKNFFEERDFEFFHLLEKEDSNEFEKIHTSENLTNFWCHQNYLPNVSFLDIPQFTRSISTYDCSLEEAAIGVLYKYFENDPMCVFFKVIEFQKEYFIVDQYVRRQPPHIRLRRMICTLKFENGSIFGIMKPLKVPELQFLQFQDMKFFKKGEEVIERGVQDFYYCGVRITPKGNKTQIVLNCIFNGKYGNMGAPKSLVNLKTMEYYKQFTDGIHIARGKQIEDFKNEFNEIKNGLPLDPFAKMLYELNLHQSLKSLIQSTISNDQKSPKNCAILNILDVVKKSDKKPIIEKNFLQNITEKIKMICPSQKKQKLDNQILENISLVVASKTIVKEQPPKIKQENFLENISMAVMGDANKSVVKSPERLEGELIEFAGKKVDSELTRMSLSFSDLDLTEMNEDCLEDILSYEVDIIPNDFNVSKGSIPILEDPPQEELDNNSIF
jgi:hypothetical protein